MEDPSKIVKAILSMCWSVFLYIMAYAVLSVALRSFHADACVVQMLSGCAVIYYNWKKAKKKGESYFRDCGYSAFTLDRHEITVLAALGFLLNCAVGGVINILPVSPALADNYRQMAAAPIEGVKPVLAFVVIAFIAPAVEETFFRGTILRRLCRDMNSLSALALTSLVFGALHGQIIWAVYASVLGLVLGMVYLLYDSIYPAIVVHMSFNLVSGIPMLMNPQWLLYRITYGNWFFILLMAIGGCIGVAWILIKFYFPRFMNLEPMVKQKKMTNAEVLKKE